MSSRVYLAEPDRIHHTELDIVGITAPLPTTKLPTSVDLRVGNKMPRPYDQGSLGSCTANALVALCQYDNPSFYGSRLFLYYNERKMIGTTSRDTGAYLTDGIKSLKNEGICSEKTWPYSISKFAVKPPSNAYSEALTHKVIQVQNISQDLNSMKNWLASGEPFTVGIAVYEEFESADVASTGIVPMPTNKSHYLGGHAVVCCGYTTNNYWIMRNSWGTRWGINGYFYLPFEYLLDHSLTSNLWVIQGIK
jgi:C1A family cysteine protease